VVNIANGARFETYAMRGGEGTGEVVINGAAARLVQPGDPVIIFSYASYDESELEDFVPTFVFVDTENRIMPRASRRSA
jgi:aspartate 1-decarboxylase